jgi:hypothetical protein
MLTGLYPFHDAGTIFCRSFSWFFVVRPMEAKSGGGMTGAASAMGVGPNGMKISDNK